MTCASPLPAAGPHRAVREVEVSPCALRPSSRQTGFTAVPLGQGVPLSAHDPPRRCAHLLHDRSPRRGVRDSFSFGPSPLAGNHHGLGCSLRVSRSPVQGSGGISPGQRRTPSPRDRRICAASPGPRALRGLRARSPCPAAPAVRCLSIGSRFTPRASSPRSVTLAPLRFTGFAVASLRADSHRQARASAARKKNPDQQGSGA